MEVYLLFSWIADSPLVGLSYLAATIVLGLVCISLAKVGLVDVIQHVMQTRRGEMLPESTRALLTLGKVWVVGVLLVFPGYLTDILAVIIWIFVGRSGRNNNNNNNRNDHDHHKNSPNAPIDVQARFKDDDD